MKINSLCSCAYRLRKWCTIRWIVFYVDLTKRYYLCRLVIGSSTPKAEATTECWLLYRFVPDNLEVVVVVVVAGSVMFAVASGAKCKIARDSYRLHLVALSTSEDEQCVPTMAHFGD